MNTQILQELQQDPENRRCCDCDRSNAVWASLSHGIYLCLECSGQHRGLGIHISFVRSLSMDSWSGRHIAFMELGGNARFKDFLSSYGLLSAPLITKYYSRAAEYYRQELKARVQGYECHLDLPSRQAGTEPFERPPPQPRQISMPTNTHRAYTESEESGFWANTRSILGGVIYKAGEMASNAAGSISTHGIVNSIKSGAYNVYESGAGIVGKVTDSDAIRNIGQKSMDALSSVGGYASRAYNTVRGQDTSGKEKLWDTDHSNSYAYPENMGGYQPPQINTRMQAPSYINTSKKTVDIFAQPDNRSEANYQKLTDFGSDSRRSEGFAESRKNDYQAFDGRDNRQIFKSRTGFDDRGDRQIFNQRPAYDDRQRYDERNDRQIFNQRPTYDEKPRYEERPRYDDRNDRQIFNQRPGYDERQRYDDRPRYQEEYPQRNSEPYYRNRSDYYGQHHSTGYSSAKKNPQHNDLLGEDCSSNPASNVDLLTGD